MIPYPSLDPVAVRIGPLAVRWYGIAYLLGFLSAYGILRREAVRGRLPLDSGGVGDLLSALVAGVLLGGRLGYVLFYNLPYFAEHPLRVVAIWEGGMSFHGALLGVVAAAWLFSRRQSTPLLRLGDALALAVTPGLFFGRLANFVNGELYGRVSDIPWAMVFPGGGPLPRHPSQLYEALLEGPLLGAIVWLAGVASGYREGRRTAAFLLGYAALRFLVEFTREPDRQLGFLVGFLTMGQLLSLALFVAGVGALVASRR
ncbi:MAG: prolipoprotein diacylglyceryl transferase [Deltaproteobacteria bacterium]|nr:prolipoprotein diacylglyceryl transferase [Deltaproteobacteria bacterium]